MTIIHVAAVGDILMWGKQIHSAKLLGKDAYVFESMFSDVHTYLKSPDLTIGNLETTLSGSEQVYERINPKTHYPMFNCPDELARALKWAGFQVLTTANNHCMDRGVSGLMRTLRVLDKHRLLHTGTSGSQDQKGRLLVLNVKGIRIGIAAYTYGTNFIEVRADQPWLVNRIWMKKIENDIDRLRRNSDIVIVSIHFGQEFHRAPSERQRNIVDNLFYYGADIVLGAHPHVLQPMKWKTVKDKYGIEKRRFVAYSLGNFVSARMWKNPLTQLGVILTFAIEKSENGSTKIVEVKPVPTWTLQEIKNGASHFRVVPVSMFIRSGHIPWSASDGKVIQNTISTIMKNG